MPDRDQVPSEAPSAKPSTARLSWSDTLAAAGLAILSFAIYLNTMHPGIVDGDSAEFQYMCPLLGVCHPPGYAIQVTAGYLFSFIPIGSIPYRITLMLAVSGVIGLVTFFFTLRRVAGNTLASLIGCGLLGFSAVYWSQAIVPEAYVFYGMFLLLAVYYTVRFCCGDRPWTFYAAALTYGVCVSNRPSEVFVFPAFLIAWLFWRRQARLTIARVALGALLAISPFVYSLGYYWVRENPTLLHARDDALRDQILNEEAPFPSLSFGDKLKDALLYCAGLKWANTAEFSGERFVWDADKLTWSLSGMGALRDRFSSNERDRRDAIRAIEQGRGSSIGAPGIVLAVVGLFFCRGRGSWAAMGVLLVVGNLVFYFYHHPPDNLDFILPAAAGFSLLAAIGVAGVTERLPRPARGVMILAAVAPAFLLVGNYNKLDCNTPEEAKRQAWLAQIGAAELPSNAAILSHYEDANALRCVFYVERGRSDVQPLIFRNRYTGQQFDLLSRGLVAQGRAVYLTADIVQKLAPQQRRALTAQTPPNLQALGIWKYSP